MTPLFSVPIQPDGESLVKTIRREGTPKRVHHIELFLDGEVQEALNQRFGIGSDLSPDDPALPWKRQIALQRFLGYDYVRVGVDGLALPVHFVRSEDAAALSRSGGRTWINERSGPIQNWEDFEKYPWPTPQTFRTATLEWYNRNLPDDMVIIGSPFGHFDEFLCWLFGYEYLCFALFEQRDLVLAVKQKLEETYEMVLRLILQFDRVRLTWASDDMGFRNGLLLGPRETRELVLPGHTRMAEISHAAGRPYLLHTCGDMSAIMEDLIEDVKIDAKHSFEDTIEDVRDTKRQYGDRLTLLGGIDVDFLCRADEQAIRKRVRDTIDACQPSGGWCLGSGNSVTNYIPVDNYLAMLDEGRRYGR